MSNINTAVNICGVEMKNPVTTASGTFGSGREFSDFVDLNKLGAVTVKGVAAELGKETTHRELPKFTVVCLTP